MSTVAQESLTREGFEASHDQTVRTEIETFRERASAFLAGQITEGDFRPFRLKHGIYGQRQAGVQMVRCKIPTGMLTVAPDRAAGSRRRRVRRRQVPPHHPAEYSISLRAAGPYGRPDALARRCRADQSRGLLQHGAQRDHLPLGRSRAERSFRRPPVRAEDRLRFPAQGSDRESAAQSSNSPSTAAPTRIARNWGSTTSGCAR